MNTALFSDKRFQLSFASIIFLLAIFHAWYLNAQHFTWNLSIADATISEIVLLLLCYVLSNLFSYYLPARNQQLYLLIWAAAIAILWLLLSGGFMLYYFASETNYILYLKNTAVLRWFFGFQVITSVAFYNALWQNQQYDAMIVKKNNDTKELAKEVALVEKKEKTILANIAAGKLDRSWVEVTLRAKGVIK